MSQCPVQDAPPVEPGCSNGPASLPTDSLNALLLAVRDMALVQAQAYTAMESLTQSIHVLIQQNAAIIEALAMSQPDDEPTHYLSGKPL